MKKRWERLKQFYYLYTSGLSRKEIEQLLGKDAREAFAYLKNKTDLQGVRRKRRGVRVIRFGRKVFVTFLMQLKPARRLVYGIGVVLFLGGLFSGDHFLLILSFLVMNFLLALELVDKLTTRDELEIARDIQLSLQPETIPEYGMLSIATFYKPAKLVGGDFFDLAEAGQDWLIGIIGDVSGKGISAALYAAYIQSMFQSLSTTSLSPSDLLQSLNGLISKRLKDGHFITAAIVMFNFTDRSVTVARAGHNWPLYYSAEANTISELKPKGLSIGMVENEQFANCMEEQKIDLKSGDFLLLYSDGITEAINPDRRMFDISGLKTALGESVHEPCETIIRCINARLFEFVTSDELQDDATMVAIKIK